MLKREQKPGLPRLVALLARLWQDHHCWAHGKLKSHSDEEKSLQCVFAMIGRTSWTKKLIPYTFDQPMNVNEPHVVSLLDCKVSPPICGWAKHDKKHSDDCSCSTTFSDQAVPLFYSIAAAVEISYLFVRLLLERLVKRQPPWAADSISLYQGENLPSPNECVKSARAEGAGAFGQHAFTVSIVRKIAHKC